jgi:hypothetical protein
MSAAAGVSMTNFRNHPQFMAVKSLFASIILKSVTLETFQLVARDSTEEFRKVFFKFGVIPRGHVFVEKNISSVSYVPHLQSFEVSHNTPAKSVTWGNGGQPFPPQIQLQLVTAEIDGTYPVAFIGTDTQLLNPDAKEELVGMRISFVLECSGQAFGAPRI